jgi:hypothetical protein
MHRNTLLLILVTLILGAPVLCTAGVLLHPCDCGEAISCAHEDACVEDPCSEIVISGTGVVLDAPPADPGFRIHPPVRTAAVVAPEPPHRNNLPCPVSVLPLLN